MRKNEKGITLISLIITVIIILILLSTIVYTGIDTYKESLVTAFTMQMQIIQEKVDMLVEENNTSLGTVIGSSGRENEINNIINVATDEITLWDTNIQNIKYFSVNDIYNILEIDNIKFDIVVNFDTREVISLEGIEYEEKMYYTQYNLPQGQKIIAYDEDSIINNRNELTTFGTITLTRNMVTANNTTIDNANGLNCSIIIPNVGLTNGSLKYKIEDGSWKTITNYTVTGQSYAIQLSKTGTYYFRLTDNTNLEIFTEESKYIEVINSPQENSTLSITSIPTEYDYSDLTDSTRWAYVTVGNVLYLWIPRLAYDSENSIKFVKGITNIATDDTYLDESVWTIPSSFLDSSGQELTGIWVEVNSTIGNNLITLSNN